MCFRASEPKRDSCGKRTFFLTNHPVVKSTFRNRYCQQNHEHRQCQGYENGHWVSKFCERYPPMLVAILTSKCASRHNAMHFFDISTYKSAPRPPVFNTFDFQMCFAPQRRALFRHLNFQKCSETLSFQHFLLPNVLRATTPCTFSTSQLPKLLRTQVFNTFYFQMCFAPQRRALFQHLNFQKWSDPEVFCTFSLRNRLRATTACNFSSLISPDVSAAAALA